MAFANQLRVLPEPVVPLAAILVAVLGAVLLTNLIAVLPGRAAARTSSAAVLRQE